MPVPRPLYPRDNTVLIVEDDRDDATIMARALQTFGTKRPSIVASGEEALAFLARQPCEIAFIDYRLPGMDGLQLLGRIHELWPETLMIIVTGVRDDRIAVAALKMGAADYIAKDDLLTVGIVRSLQVALREQIASREEERRVVLSTGEDRIGVASEEAEWLRESIASGAEPSDYRRSGGAVSQYGREGWPEIIDAFCRYLHACFDPVPELAAEPEAELVRRFGERGSSPQEVTLAYQAVLRVLSSQSGVEPPLNPTVCLARILARLLEEYQRRLFAIEGKEEAA
jgi:ActR/RegA family two-component response regulator